MTRKDDGSDLNDDLTARVRRPKRWMLRHPIRAARRHSGAALVFLFFGVVAGILAYRQR